MHELGKYLIVIGGICLVTGVVLYFFGASFRWVGNLPGDFRFGNSNFMFYFPLTTLIILNLLIFLITRIVQWLK